MSRFQMQHWSQDDDGTRGWEPMENGAAASVWRPRATAIDAAAKCMAWTGPQVGIPAMQVVDLETGDVVFRHNPSGYYPDAGPEIPLPGAEQHVALAQVRAIYDGHKPAEPPRAAPDELDEQEALF